MDEVNESASDYFGAMVDDYDRLIRSALPRYQEMIDTLVDFLPERPERVLELGCGTGTYTLALVDRSPDASLTVVDASPEMVEVTRRRVHVHSPDFAKRTTFAVARFEELALPAESFDLVTSCISLHHIEGKASFLEMVWGLLTPGGTLRFADQLLGGTSENHARIWDSWLEFCRSEGHCSEEEVRSLLDHADAHDHYESLTRHLQLLADAGFDALDCPWRHGMWGIITADKSTIKPD